MYAIYEFGHVDTKKPFSVRLLSTHKYRTDAARARDEATVGKSSQSIYAMYNGDTFVNSCNGRGVNSA